MKKSKVKHKGQTAKKLRLLALRQRFLAFPPEEQKRVVAMMKIRLKVKALETELRGLNEKAQMTRAASVKPVN